MFSYIFQRQFACELLGLTDSSIFYENLKGRVVERTSSTGAAAIESLGLLDDVTVVKKGSPLDTLSHYLTKKLVLGEIIFRHWYC